MGFTLHRGFESRPLRWRAVGGPFLLQWPIAAPVAQLDRASVYGTEGQRFESSRARHESPAMRGFLVLVWARRRCTDALSDPARSGRSSLITVPAPAERACFLRLGARSRRPTSHRSSRAR